MEPEPPALLNEIIIQSLFNPFDWSWVYMGILIVFLLLCSALISGSEVAFFSLKKDDEVLEDNDILKSLIHHPEQLLATILIVNNIVNIAIVIITEVFLSNLINFQYFDQEHQTVVEFLIKVAVATSFLLLFGEVLPKVYANKQPQKFANMMTKPMFFLNKRLAPISKLMSKATSVIEEKNNKLSISVSDLSQALEITQEQGESQNEQMILQGIAKFGNTDSKQIMTPRTQVFAVDILTPFDELLEHILQSGYSRIPVYQEKKDKVKGIIYIKDLLPYLRYESNFRWQVHLREAFFITENIKLDDLLREFQKRRTHIAVVSDEYGGMHGIVTMEDILEEIVGDIRDEMDDDRLEYQKIDEKNFIFEGQIFLKDFYRAVDHVNEDAFEENKGDSETLAGFVLEQCGKLPQKDEMIHFQDYSFTIVAIDERRILKLKFTLND
ncbi:MAG: gliding motility-associated protein GldE [Flavobacteriales bacterium]|nr:gliding motility-associated protein GldE [Flavobacteriales bacterium]